MVDRDGTEPAPEVADDVSLAELDDEVRRDLKVLDAATAQRVGGHLAMVTRLLDIDPEAALAHARAARARAARVGVVREIAGVTAYVAGEWKEAAAELRAARRLTGDDSVLPMIADCERGLGRPERAVELGKSPEAAALSGSEAVELMLVVAGAYLDMGQPEHAVAELKEFGLTPGRTGADAARLFYVYAAALEAAGRTSDAVTWFQNAAAADVEDITDAEFRLAELLEQGADLTSADPAPAQASAGARLVDDYDGLFFDLDGTLFTGASVLPGAQELVHDAGRTVCYVTNNASRTPAEVAAHLADLGFPASAEQVVTSAHVAAQVLAETLPASSKVLVVGSPALAEEVRARGLTVVDSAGDEPAAVVQGMWKQLSWAELSEAALAVGAGARWMACNLDNVLPDERGFMVGNGGLVAAVQTATGVTPEVAGKPAAPIMREARARSGSRRPLMFGDRLDTDIEAAHSVGIDSLLVFTGVTTLPDVFAAAEQQRPTHLAIDLTYADRPSRVLRVGPQDGWRVSVIGEHAEVTRSGGADLAGLAPALTHAVWTADVGDRSVQVAAGDDEVADSLRRLGVTVVS